MRIFLIGYMGSGKSSIGKKLAAKLKMKFIDLDNLIEIQQKKTINKIFYSEGEEAFREYEKNALYSLKNEKNVVVATGGGTPCFYDNIHWMNKMGETIFFDIPVNYLIDRISASKKVRPLISGLTGDKLINYVNNSLRKRLPFYEKSKHKITGLRIRAEDVMLIF